MSLLRVRFLALSFLCLMAPAPMRANGPAPLDGVVAYAGDRSVIVHWEQPDGTTPSGYQVLRATSPDGPFQTIGAVTPQAGFADLTVGNDLEYHYRVRPLLDGQPSGPDSATVSAVPRAFADDAAFLEYIQRAHFDYFWYLANPLNGLIPDRSTPTSPCSIAAVGFGLSALTIGIDRGWIPRARAAERARRTLRTFVETPQGATSNGRIGHRGWFYHFIDMRTAARAWSSELSTIDTALLLAGVLHAREYFDGADPVEAEIRGHADALLAGVDWDWIRAGLLTLPLGWMPESGFLNYRWIGYNEAMILYVLGLGARTNPLPSASWTAWTSGYRWRTNYNQSYVLFRPLFGHQYSHCWIDFRHTADPYMRARGSTYFENSRRATLAQHAYCIENPGGFPGYGPLRWGITACDGPGFAGINGYIARGAPPAENDDGTLAPTAVGGSIAFAPEICLPTLRHLYDTYRERIWTPFGFRDAFNLRVDWWGPDTLGIDQGAIVLMIENHRTGAVWNRLRHAPEIVRGMAAAGFAPLDTVPATLLKGYQPVRYVLRWNADAGVRYQVEWSPDLEDWRVPMSGWITAENPASEWEDSGLPAGTTPPNAADSRFYRVFRLGP